MVSTIAYQRFYDERRAATELTRYRARGPTPSTRALIEALEAEGVRGATLLDIGGGIGAIHHELIAAGAASATDVDASRPYLDAARAESERRGHADRVSYVHGDFVELAESIPAADIVTLDRVINVYPDWERLTRLAAVRAKRLLGLVYPRDTAMVALVIRAMNVAFRLRGQEVRAAIRPEREIERIARDAGLQPSSFQNVGRPWRVAIFRRAQLRQ
ncbi:MAG: class I SAM-dependent methyltransferase [Steroidobacteraceae bacterium]